MRLLNRLERRFGRLAIPSLTVYLAFAQVCTFFLCLSRPELRMELALSHDAVAAGEWWRLATVIIFPPFSDPLFLIFEVYIFYLMGTALESHWGTFRYNLFLLVGYLLTLAVALIPHAIVVNTFWMSSVFLAFAWLYPDYELLLFLLIPTKVKWLAVLAWGIDAYFFIMGDLATRAQVLAAAGAFVIFFHGDLWQWAKSSRRRAAGSVARIQQRGAADEPMHVCAECGVSDLTDRKMEFRYCPQCKGTPAYCIHHIATHQHR